MENVRGLLLALGSFQETFRKAVKAKTQRNHWISQLQKSSADVLRLLEIPDIQHELDGLLLTVFHQLSDPEVPAIVGATLSKDLVRFVQIESHLRGLVRVRKLDYMAVVEEVSPWLSLSQTGGFPRDATAFRSEFQQIANEAMTVLSSAIELPRRQKKEDKSYLTFKIWRYSLGTMITLANVAVTYQQPNLFKFGTASITVGYWFFKLKDGRLKKPSSGAKVSKVISHKKTAKA